MKNCDSCSWNNNAEWNEHTCPYAQSDYCIEDEDDYGAEI